MRENGRTKAMLCEMLIVALFLSLSSITLLRLFATSSAVSRDSEVRASANLLVQDTLERLIAGEELPQTREEVMGDHTFEVRVEAQPQEAAAGALTRYAVVVDCAGREIARVKTAAYRPEGGLQ